ncbi:MAG TPA: hypothetical protein VFD92_07940 [Candidatus Binatia bacterium]|nr:hypothetical protein [Candidatus Binatia bacterium]
MVAADGAEPANSPPVLACDDLAQVPGEPGFKAPGTIEATNELTAQTLVVRNAQRRLCVPTEIVGDR